jgi:hypothetical protein
VLHHVELWVPDLPRATRSWGWLLGRLGWRPYRSWENGRSWRLGGTYLVVEQSPAMSAGTHDRLRPGLNHLAFHAGPATRPTAGLPCSPTAIRTPVAPGTTRPTSSTPTASRRNSSRPRPRPARIAPNSVNTQATWATRVRYTDASG